MTKYFLTPRKYLKKIQFLGLILIITTVQSTFGQTKVYNGSFNSLHCNGRATYNYIEQPDKRIFHGPFTFRTSFNSTSMNISGSFQNDLKNGAWKIIMTNFPYSDVLYDKLITASAWGNFKNGNVDGVWNFSQKYVISVKTTAGIGLSAFAELLGLGSDTDYSKSRTFTEKSTANFKENHFVGSFSESRTDALNEEPSSVKGQFNEQGYFEGTWTVNYYEDGTSKMQTRNYKNGVLVIVKNKNNSTGDVSTIYDIGQEVTDFFQNYNVDENISKVGDTYYKLIETEINGGLIENDELLLKRAVDIWYNNFSLNTSACFFEIERGTNKMSTSPQRIIVLDEERTQKQKEEEERIAKVQSQFESLIQKFNEIKQRVSSYEKALYSTDIDIPSVKEIYGLSNEFINFSSQNPSYAQANQYSDTLLMLKQSDEYAKAIAQKTKLIEEENKRQAELAKQREERNKIREKELAEEEKEREYKNKGKYFTSREDFDAWYNRGEAVYLPEAEKREAIGRIKRYSEFIKSMDFQNEKKESTGSAVGRGLLSAATGANVHRKDYTNENNARESMLSEINDSKNKPYYSEILDFVIATNKDLNKEWTKNGHYFSNNAEFYEAYISGDYKQKLKAKK